MTVNWSYRAVPRRRFVFVVLAAATVAVVSACDQLLTKPSRYHSVSVSAKTRLGEAIPGVKLELYTGPRPMDYAVTNAAGTWTFADVPDGEYGVYLYEVPAGFHATSALSGGPTTLIQDGLPVNATSSPIVNFVLLRDGFGTVVALLNQPDGTPLPSVAVWIINQSGQSISAAVSDVNGRAVFNHIPYGLYFARVANPTWPVTAGAPQYLTSAPLPIDDGAVDTAQLLVQQCTGSITLRVLNGSGQGVPSYPLRLYTFAAILQEPQTTANGTYVFSGLQCGEYGVAILAKAGFTFIDALGSSYQTVVVLNSSNTTVTFQVSP